MHLYAFEVKNSTCSALFDTNYNNDALKAAIITRKCQYGMRYIYEPPHIGSIYDRYIGRLRPIYRS